MVRVFLLILFMLSISISSEEKYCIQVATYRSFELAKTDFERIKDFPGARIELRGDVYLLRVGAEERSRDLTLMLRKVRRFFPDAFVKKCEIDPSYVVYPEPKDTEVTEEASVRESELKESIEELRKEISMLRMEVASARTENNDTPDFEKFLFSVGIFLGGMFLFTWFLIILVYRRIGSVSLHEAKLVNDLLSLIKVLSHLGKGHIVKMERGKIMVYDKEKDRWKEVE